MITLIFRFSAPIAKTEFCQVLLDETKLKSFLYAVKNHYWYQMYLDDLPVWGESDLTLIVAAVF